MKQLNRFSRVLKVIGIVLICVAVAIWLYVLANTGKPWNALNTTLTSNDIRTNLIDRFAFDERFFSALSEAAANREADADTRIGQAKVWFTRWFEKLEAVGAAKDAAAFEEGIRYIREDLDAAAFLGRLENIEELQESQEIRTIFEYINSFGAVAKGKAAKLQAASKEPYFQDYYAAFSQEHGEDAGTWYEFVNVVKVMLEDV